MNQQRNRQWKKRRKIVIRIQLLCGMIVFLISFSLGMLAASARYKKTLQMVSSQLTESEQESKKENMDDSMEEDKKDILLVNREHALPEAYEVDLVTLEDGVHQCAREAYEPLCEMLRAGIMEGLTFEVCSAYRSSERQEELFQEDLQAFLRQGYSYQRAWELTAQETMPAGYSEHSTGLAFDIVSFHYQMLDAGQENTVENKWLQEHCAEYGFILRYPKDKEAITQISYESWHFRYVGVEAAKEIMEQGITLEEYLW